MKDETVARFILRKKILDIIDDLKGDDKYGNDPSNVVEFAILQLYSESKDDLEKADENMIGREITRQQLQDKEEEDKAENPYFNSELNVDNLDQILSELDPGESISRAAVQPYGEGYLGLIWNFHNRMLPVKFVLHVIASDIVENKNLHSLETARMVVGEQGSRFAEKIYGDSNYGRFRLDSEDDRRYRILIGFPKTLEAMMEQPKIKKLPGRGGPDTVKGRKSQEAVQDSKYFFVDKFLGNELKISKKKQDEIDFYKGKNLRKFGGACFEMGLVKVDSDSRLSLTELGRDFLGYENPILGNLVGQIRSDSLKMSGDVLSKDEVKFIIEKIIKPQFSLEYKMIKKILENSDILSITQIMHMLKNEQQDYIEKNRIENRTDERDNGNLIKYRQQRATSTAMRLVEMGLLERQDEPKDGEHVDKIAKSDEEYTNALKNEIEIRIKEGIASDEEEIEYESLKFIEETKKLNSRLGRPKAFYRRTDFGREVHEKILSKN
jgi:hypothetical protein